MVKENIFQYIADYCIEEVKKNSNPSMGGFQSTIEFSDVIEKFNTEINEYINEKICDSIAERKEVADVEIDTDGFDIVLYTNHAPNYNNNF